MLAAAELPRALMTRVNFIPGVRHRLGWRGVRDCAKGNGGLTVRITGMAGVFGLHPLNTGERSTGRAWRRSQFFIFRPPTRSLIERFSVQAGIAAQADDYLDRVREFTLHDDLRALFGIAVLEAYFHPDSGVSLALTAPERDIVLAHGRRHRADVLGSGSGRRARGRGPEPARMGHGGPLSSMRLAASASYCLGLPPQSLIKSSRPGNAS